MKLLLSLIIPAFIAAFLIILTAGILGSMLAAIIGVL